MRSLTSQVKALAELLQNLIGADAGTAVWPLAQAFVADYGFTQLTGVQRIEEGETTRPLKLFGEIGDAALERFNREGWSSKHPLIVGALATSEPVTLCEMRAIGAEAWLGLIAEQEGGQVDGLFVPVRDRDLTLGIVAVAGIKPDLSPVTRSIVHVALETTFRRAQSAANQQAPSAKLSPREAAILRWAAVGKTDSEIGQIMKISARTVRFHTDNAKRKLHVATRIQAVTEAVRLGLIVF